MKNQTIDAEQVMDALLTMYENYKKQKELLEEMLLFFSPYDRSINGRDCGDLLYRAHEIVHQFNDSE